MVDMQIRSNVDLLHDVSQFQGSHILVAIKVRQPRRGDVIPVRMQFDKSQLQQRNECSIPHAVDCRQRPMALWLYEGVHRSAFKVPQLRFDPNQRPQSTFKVQLTLCSSFLFE